jgi:hypothetical protein
MHALMKDIPYIKVVNEFNFQEKPNIHTLQYIAGYEYIKNIMA